MAQINKRGGNITNTSSTYGTFTIKADVALANMFGYATELRGATQGMGEFNMEYKTHAPVNPMDVQKITDAYKKKIKDERS